MPSQFVLVDFENIQPESLEVIASGDFKLIVFVGASQNKVAFDIAEAVQGLGPKARYVKISGNGSNALDFHIAYYIGKLSGENPGARFFIVSKDTGFDPLITHLNMSKVSVARIRALDEIVKGAKPGKAVLSKSEQVEARLEQMKAAKPRTLKTLTSTVAALFGKKLPDDEVAALVNELAETGLIQIEGTKVAYSLCGEPKS